MNKLWVRLSLAFFGVITLTAIALFSIYFVLSWVGSPPFSAENYTQEYIDLTAPYIETYIVKGKSDTEILALVGDAPQARSLLQQKRADGWATGVSLEDRSFGRIFGDYVSELMNPDLILTIFLGTLIGIAASIWLSRQLSRPLAQLTEASQALGQNDLSQRVEVTGSDEINRLSTTFNEMAAQLEQTEHVRQTMLADVSHELRTPLAGLEGTLRATLDGVFELDDQHMSNLYQQTRHLTRLVDDLHLLARAEAKRLPLDKTTVDLTVLLQQIAEMFEVLAQDTDVVLATDFVAVRPIHADAARVRQIVSNLLNNALRHTPAGGTITLSLAQQANQVVISVKDTGEGISAEHLPHLFDRFYRADASRSRDTGGSGLGLAITKALVEAHGGEISTESAGVNQGSTFRIELLADG